MNIVSQLNIVMPNVPGNLASVSDRLRAADVNIEALSCTEGSPSTILHLIVDDPDTAKLVLQPVYRVTMTDVLEFTMKNKPGAVANIGRACAAAGINIKNVYATTCGKEATVYVSVEDLPKAKEMLDSWKKTFAKITG